MIRVGIGTVDATAAGTQPVLVDCTTHDSAPLTGGGTCIFQQINVIVRHDQGFQIGVTPIIDGRAEPEQFFSAATPPANADGQTTVAALLRVRGERCGARVRQLAAFGIFELANIELEFVPLRGTEMA